MKRYIKVTAEVLVECSDNFADELLDPYKVYHKAYGYGPLDKGLPLRERVRRKVGSLVFHNNNRVCVRATAEEVSSQDWDLKKKW